MKTKSLARLMKTIIILLALCGVVLFGAAVPFCGNELKQSYPEFSYCYIPWLVYVLIMAIPCYSVLVIAWKIASSISKEKIFTAINSNRLKNVAVISILTSGYLLTGNIIFLLLNMNHPAVLLGSMLVVFIGVCITAASAILSHLVQKAAVLQEQSDLTI